RRAQFCEESSLDLDDLLLRIENLGLILLQFGSGEALSVHQRLFALVIGGREVEIGFGDLEVIAEDRIEAHLQGRDPGSRTFTLFDPCDMLFRIATEVAQLVESRIDTVGDHAAIRDRKRWFRDQRSIDARTHVSEFVDLSMKLAQAFRAKLR